MPLRNSPSSFKVRMDLSEPFHIMPFFRWGGPLSCDLFNFLMESVLGKEEVHRNGTIFQKCFQLHAYTCNIIGRTKRDVIATFSAIEREFIKMRLTAHVAYRQVEMCSMLILRLRPIFILLIQSRNSFILALPLPPKMMSIWRSKAVSL